MPGQWPDCPDSQRNKVHGINLAIQDEANPCELAQQLGVPISHLWARQVPDGRGNMWNDFYLPLSNAVVRRIAAGKKARPKTRKSARPKTRKRRSSK
jgi:hypothetical protein